jgi:hypothetical protein
VTDGRLRELKAKLDQLKAERVRSAERVQKLQAENARVIRQAETARRILERA